MPERRYEGISRNPIGSVSWRVVREVEFVGFAKKPQIFTYLWDGFSFSCRPSRRDITIVSHLNL